MQYSKILIRALKSGRLTLHHSAQGVPLAAYFEGNCTEFRELCGLSSLTHLTCDSSYITDECFANLCQLRSLEELSLQFTRISGGEFRYLERLPNLMKIICNPERQIEEAIISLSRCPLLEDVDLTCMRISNELIHVLICNKTVRHLNLSQTIGLTDDWLKHAPEWGLESISVSDTMLGDCFCESVAITPQVLSLNVSGTQVSDAGVSQVLRQSHVNTIKCDNTKVSDSSMIYIANASQLQSLSVANCDITDKSVPMFVRHPSLIYLNLSGTKISPRGIQTLKSISTWEKLVL